MRLERELELERSSMTELEEKLAIRLEMAQFEIEHLKATVSVLNAQN